MLRYAWSNASASRISPQIPKSHGLSDLSDATTDDQQGLRPATHGESLRLYRLQASMGNIIRHLALRKTSPMPMKNATNGTNTKSLIIGEHHLTLVNIIQLNAKSPMNWKRISLTIAFSSMIFFCLTKKYFFHSYVESPEGKPWRDLGFALPCCQLGSLARRGRGRRADFIAWKMVLYGQ